jgi:exopolysaccharide biosynthesis polyprenyl glycosylphosphotransferase
VSVREDRQPLAGAALAPIVWRIRLPARWRLRSARLQSAAILAGDAVATLAALLTIGRADPWLPVVAVGAAIAWSVGGFYHCRLTLSILDDLPHLLSGMFAVTGVVVTAASILGSSEQRRLVTDAALLAGYLIFLRTLVYGATRHARRAGRLVRNAVIVGAGELGTRLARDLAHHPEYGLRVAGFVDDMPASSYDSSGPLSGECSALGFYIHASRSDVIVLADPVIAESRLLDQLRTYDPPDCEILFVPRLSALQPLRAGDRAWSVPLARLAPPAQRRPSWRAKRLFDIVVSGAALALLAPVLLITAMAVRFEIGPSVIFRQERVGRDGRRFTLLKFRSLRPVDEAESRTRWNIANDDRLGPVGRVIRASSLDELPQLVNVLRGDMSLVGPRPERPFFAERFAREIPNYAHRHRVNVGLTGWAAIHGLRGDTSIAERAHFDNFYIDNWSFWTDVKVMIRTIPAMLRRAEPGAVLSAGWLGARMRGSRGSG